jgi:predicted RNA polymerase sigma factor
MSTSRHVPPGAHTLRMTEHEPGCPLHAAAWLDRDTEQALTDRAASASLQDTARRFDEVDLASDARLTGELRRAAPPDDELRLAWCTCHRGAGNASP